MLALGGGVLLAAWSLAVRAADEPPVAAEPGSEPGAKPATEVSWQNTVKMFAAALAISLTAFATGFTQSRIGSAGVGALAENPKLFGNILIFLVIPETMVILGFVIAALILF
jgi:V/A-type H+-transporting ATPase subunit K